MSPTGALPEIELCLAFTFWADGWGLFTLGFPGSGWIPWALGGERAAGQARPSQTARELGVRWGPEWSHLLPNMPCSCRKPATPFQKPQAPVGAEIPCFLCSVKHVHHLLTFRISEPGQERTAHSEPRHLGPQPPRCLWPWARTPSPGLLQEGPASCGGVAPRPHSKSAKQAGMCV